MCLYDLFASLLRFLSRSEAELFADLRAQALVRGVITLDGGDVEGVGGPRKLKMSFTFMGVKVCVDAFATLYGVGRHPRLTSLLKAVMNREKNPPLDLRYVKRIPRAEPTAKRGEVWSFLCGLWAVAESLPDDSLSAFEEDKNEGLQQVVKVKQTWYADLVPEEPAQEMKHLPPGSHAEYFRQFKALATGQCSQKLFMDVWEKDFPNLRIRAKGRHTMCPICIKHKLVMKKLRNNEQALNRQRSMYDRHLAAQYLDRKRYWAVRADARLQLYTLAVICDGMDQAKFGWPRSPDIVDNHNFDRYQRPRLHLFGAIIHGHAMLLTLSHNDISKSGSTTVDVLAFVLTYLHRKGIVLNRCFLHLQLDNTSSTNKNNVLMSFLGAMVTSGKLAGCQAAFLRVGHTHEDHPGTKVVVNRRVLLFLAVRPDASAGH